MFSETHHIDQANVTGAYKSTLFFLTACVNSDWFQGFAPVEDLFLGAFGTQRGQEEGCVRVAGSFQAPRF